MSTHPGPLSLPRRGAFAGSGGGAAGHLWTVGALLGRGLRPATAPPGLPFVATVDDPVTGPQPVSGRLCRPPGARRLVVLVHGLGGSAESSYMSLLASLGHELGHATLRLSLRGADGSGPDLYHGGLTADLHAALADPATSVFDEFVLAGLSLGGHMALRYANYGYILENGRVVMDGKGAELAENEDVKEFYLGVSGEQRKSFRDVKHYRRRKRWLA